MASVTAPAAMRSRARSSRAAAATAARSSASGTPAACCLGCGRGDLAGERRRAAKAQLGRLGAGERLGGAGGAFGGGEPLPRRVVRGDGRFGGARGSGFPRLRLGEAFGSGIAAIAGRGGSGLGVRVRTAGPVVGGQGLGGRVALEHGGAPGVTGGVEPRPMLARGLGGAPGLGEGGAAGLRRGRVCGGGERVAKLGAFGERRGEVGALGVEPAELGAQRGGLVLGQPPAAARPSGGRWRWRSRRAPPRSGRRSRRDAGRR